MASGCPEPDRYTQAYVLALWALSVAAIVGWSLLAGWTHGWVSLISAVVLLPVCALARLFPVEFRLSPLGRVSVEVGEVAVLVALVAAGPLWALLVALPSVFYRDPLRTAYSVATRILGVLAAAGVMRQFSEPLLQTDARFSGQVALGIVLAAFTYYVIDFVVTQTLFRIKYGTPYRQSFVETILPPLPSDVLALATVLGTSWAITGFGPAAPLAVFSGAAVAVAVLGQVKSYLDRVRDLEKELRLSKAEAAGAINSPITFATRLVEDLGEKDGYTAYHAAATSVYARDLAHALGLGPERASKLELAALVMNVGFVSVPDEVLAKAPQKLNSLGRAQIETHPTRSESLLSGIPGFEEASKWVRWHHEREDGTGYPDRLRGEWMPLEAKVLALCSHYASLVLDKPYGPATTAGEARARIVSEGDAGAFDARVVRTFLRILDREDDRYAGASDGRFALPGAPYGSEGSGGTPHRRLGLAE